MENIILIGSSGHAKVLIDVVEKQGLYRVCGFVDSFRGVGEETLGYPVLGTEADVARLVEQYNLRGCLIAVGDNSARAVLAARVSIISPELPFVTAIHPAAVIGNQVVLGEGTVVMAGAVINPCSHVGKHCILNTNSVLDHDSRMGDYSSLAPGVTTGGKCAIGPYSAISVGATLIHGVTVGEHAVIGAGSTVLNDIDAYALAYGTPAKPVRQRQPGDKYL